MYSEGILLVFLTICYALGFTAAGCVVAARTESGWVCGKVRTARGGGKYASFRGVPYAKQPLGDLRFKELQPAEHWQGCFNATVEGPICPNHDIFYGPLMKPHGVSEACIHANIHVPLDYLPGPDEPSWPWSWSPNLPILVYIHGGAWICGSGDSDINGPEYMMPKGVIVITFNYRLDVFGFLSLNTPKVPGNNGLRDAVTLLRWVRRNARSFGGDPDQVTLAGQSGGAANVHLLSLSPVAAGLFQRAWIMSSTAYQTYYSTTQAYAQQARDMFLGILGINSTDYDQVHDQLVKMPLDTIMNASAVLVDHYGFTSFVPVVETPLPNVPTIIPDDPETMMSNGYGNSIPLVVGFTNAEFGNIRIRLDAIDALARYKANPVTILPVHFLFIYPQDVLEEKARKAAERYFKNGTATMDGLVQAYADMYFVYPAMKLARARAASGGAPVHLYKFSYSSPNSVFKVAFKLQYSGAAHGEDLSYILKVNSVVVPDSKADDWMRDTMSGLMANYVIYGNPAATVYSSFWWPTETPRRLSYLDISKHPHYKTLTKYEQEMVQFFDTYIYA